MRARPAPPAAAADAAAAAREQDDVLDDPTVFLFRRDSAAPAGAVVHDFMCESLHERDDQWAAVLGKLVDRGCISVVASKAGSSNKPEGSGKALLVATTTNASSRGLLPPPPPQQHSKTSAKPAVIVPVRQAAETVEPDQPASPRPQSSFKADSTSAHSSAASSAASAADDIEFASQLGSVRLPGAVDDFVVGSCHTIASPAPSASA
jgi:hypothetical protein